MTIRIFPQIPDRGRHGPFKVEPIRPGPGQLEGGVDIGGGTIRVPLTDDCDARHIRRHELTHIAISPVTVDKYKGIDPHYLQLAEDTRVNRAIRIQDNGEHTPLSASCAARMAERVSLALAHDDPVEAAVSALWARDTTIGEDVLKHLRAQQALPIGQVASYIYDAIKVAQDATLPEDHVPTFEEYTLPFAKLLSTLAAANKAGEIVAPGGRGEAGFAEEGEKETPVGYEPLPEEEPKYGRIRSGAMTIIKPALVRAHRGAMRALTRRRLALHGPRLGRLDRYATDGAIFLHRRKVTGGTALYDTSGSMCVTMEMIKEVLDAAPGMTVATYHSADFPGFDSGACERGTLHIIARDGRICSDDALDDATGGGNVVDLPALKWLAKQKAPRFWICDGGVTGVGDQQTMELRVACDAVARKAGIERIHNGFDFARRMESMKKKS